MKVGQGYDLTQEEVQGLLDGHVAALVEKRNAYLEESKADPTIGGSKLAETQRLGEQFLDRLAPVGTPHGDFIRAELNRTGLGNHKHILLCSLKTGIGRTTTHKNAMAHNKQ